MTRQQRRWAERHPTPTPNTRNTTNRHARRAALSRRREGTTIPATDLAWLGGLLEGESYVGVTRAYQPRRGYAPNIAISAPPKLLSVLRRKFGGIVRNGKWLAVGRRAEAILFAAQNRLVKHEQPATVALAMAEYQRRHKGISPTEAQAFIANLVPSNT